jgi:hypothetical protein
MKRTFVPEGLGLAGLALAGLLLAGCGSTNEAAKKPEGQAAAGDNLQKYESDFRPSDHDPIDVAAAARDTLSETADTAAAVQPDQPVEYVQGFRVQIFASTSIDAAKQRKTEAEGLFPKEWFYIQYDPPTYKIRAGNFLQRYEAERFVKQADEQGFRDAWAVPERVIKNPPPVVR